MKTTREVQGSHAGAYVALQRLAIDLLRDQKRDPVGFELRKAWLSDIRIFLDDIEKPIQQAVDFEEAIDLRGQARFVLDTINRKLDILLPLKASLEARGGRIPILNNRRRATDLVAK